MMIISRNLFQYGPASHTRTQGRSRYTVSTWSRAAEVFSNIADNHLLDVNGIILYLSLIVLFFFLTMQMIQKRRWS